MAVRESADPLGYSGNSLTNRSLIARRCHHTGRCMSRRKSSSASDGGDATRGGFRDVRSPWWRILRSCHVVPNQGRWGFVRRPTVSMDTVGI